MSPNKNKTNIETPRSKLGETPVARTILERNKVKKVKLATNPITTPKGLFLPSPIVEERMIGNSGKMQGERIVTIPARNAKAKRIIITLGLSEAH